LSRSKRSSLVKRNKKLGDKIITQFSSGEKMDLDIQSQNNRFIITGLSFKIIGKGTETISSFYTCSLFF
jgi:hypothetical protein